MAVYSLYNIKETEAAAAALARRLRAGDVLCLSGALGAGKTAFTRGLCRALGYDGGVTSPTFALMHVYEGGRLTVYHFDLYRLEGATDLESIGCEEYFDAGGVCVLEWPERAGIDWPPNTIHIEIKTDLTRDENYRELIIRNEALRVSEAGEYENIGY